MRVSLGEAKSELSELVARVQAGHEVEIARDGVPVARLVRIEAPPGNGVRFMAARGSLSGQISIGDDFEFSEQELDEMFGGAA